MAAYESPKIRISLNIVSKIIKKINHSNISYIALIGGYLVLFLLYWEHLSMPFVYDSIKGIQHNPFEKSDLWVQFKNSFDGSRHLFNFINALIAEIFGVKSFYFRLFGLIAHLLTSFALFLTIDEIKYHIKSKSNDIFLKNHALWTALFFAFYPACIYSVTYTVQLMIVYCSMFALYSLFFFLKGIRLRKYSYLALSLLCFVCSTRSKEHSLLMPFIYILFCLVSPKKFFEKIKWSSFFLIMCLADSIYIALSRSYLLATIYEPGAMLLQKTTTDSSFLLNNSSNSSYFLSILNQCRYFFKYLYLWIVPDLSNMAFDLPSAFPNKFDLYLLIAPILILSLAFVLIKFFIRGGKKQFFSLCILYFCIHFIVEFSTTRYHEIFTLYRSYLWFPLIFGLVPYIKNAFNHNIRPYILPSYLVLLIFLLKIQLMTIRTPALLWKDAVRKLGDNPENKTSSYRTYYNYATRLLEENQLDLSIAYYKKANSLLPNLNRIWHGLGVAQFRNNEILRAIESFKKSIKYGPNYLPSYNNLSIVYLKARMYDNAIDTLKKSLDLVPSNGGTHYNIATIYLKQQKFELAKQHLQKSIALSPNFYKSYYHLGILAKQDNNIQKSIKFLRKALDINPAFKPAQNALAHLKRLKR